jgi:hypothetical protein
LGAFSRGTPYSWATSRRRRVEPGRAGDQPVVAAQGLRTLSLAQFAPA